MDPNTIIEALRGTMDPALREAAERQLNEAHKSLNFVSTLLQITMSEQLDLPVRQAGVIYLKNMITQYWPDREAAPGDISPYTIPEEDRHCIRENIVEAIIHSPELIRYSLLPAFIISSNMITQVAGLPLWTKLAFIFSLITVHVG